MTVLVTGTSRGIGAGLAKAYRARGEEVIGTTRAGRWPLEITDRQSHQALAQKLSGKSLDLLVCNAGVFPDKGETLDNGYAPNLWAEAFAVNVTGVFLTIQALLPNLAAANHGKIAILSSQMASSERAPGGSYIYRATKAAVLNLGRNLAADLRPRGIAVGIYHPGWVVTDMGGATADISVDEAVKGLLARFNALDLGNTGCFETWDGRAHPY